MKVLTECTTAALIVELLNGKTVIVPTETSYGLGCDAVNQSAVDAVFAIKGRPSDKPLLVVVPTIAMAKKYLY
jgi:L-threonylcarbamoyladenylate synthase